LLRRIRELMDTPLARPPGRRGFLSEFTAGWLALSIYAAFLIAWLATDQLRLALALVYVLAGLVLFVGPLWSGAMAWARERQGATLEPLLLAPHKSTERVLGRFLHVFGPWVRLLVYLLPLSFTSASIEPFWSDEWNWYEVLLSVLVPRHLWLYFVTQLGSVSYDWPSGGLLGDLLRFANQFTVAFFACAAAYHISVRARSVAGALVGAGLVALGMLTVLSLHGWLMVIGKLGVLHLASEGIELLFFGAYVSLGMLAAVVRIWLGLWLLRLAVRNFDAWALGEKPG
jgi:hypothetical protein